jgi:hypothetical protein
VRRRAPLAPGGHLVAKSLATSPHVHTGSASATPPLGLHTANETVFGRLTRDGDVTPIVEVEGNLQ